MSPPPAIAGAYASRAPRLMAPVPLETLRILAKVLFSNDLAVFMCGIPTVETRQHAYTDRVLFLTRSNVNFYRTPSRYQY